MLTAATVVAAVWLAAAVTIARRRHAPVLWGRALLILAAAYSLGAWSGAWPWDAARPLLDWIITGLGG